MLTLFNFQANYVKSKAVTKAVSQCLPPDIIKATGMNAEENCTMYKAVVSENKTLINTETPIVYDHDQQQVYIVILILYVKSAKI